MIQDELISWVYITCHIAIIHIAKWIVQDAYHGLCLISPPICAILTASKLKSMMEMQWLLTNGTIQI
jgi:hypothetical protein